MKQSTKILALALALTMALGMLAACAPAAQPAADATAQPTDASAQEGKFTPGTYTATGKGNNGDVTVSVTFSADAITEVTVGEHGETAGISDPAIERIPAAIVDGQTLAVDTVSGATNTSKAILAAVEDCVKQAGGDVEALKAAENVPEESVSLSGKTADIIVVGGGIAGLRAAWVAAETGKSVILVEKAGVLGGNALMSDGNISAAGTSMQKANGIEDSTEQWLKDTINPDSDYRTDNPAFTRLLYDGSTAAVEELIGVGVEFVFSSDYPRGHLVGPEAYASAPLLVQKIIDLGTDAGVEYITDTRATHVLVENGMVKGVTVEQGGQSADLYADAVILATGGFCNNKEMVAQYCPDYANVPARVCAGATGDGILMAQEVGAGLRAMDAGIHASSKSVVTDMDICFSIIYNPCIVVNQEGNRFMAEDINYGPAGTAIAKQTGSMAYVVFDKATLENDATMQQYLDQGVLVEAASIEELGEKLNTPGLSKTVEAYNIMAAKGEDADFGRTTYVQPLEGDSYYAMEVVPYIYYSYGGILVDTDMKVLTEAGEAIPGLYACGEAIGSPQAWEGFVYECGLGNGLAFGKIAAESATAYIDGK